ncbi:MAG: endonuclease/exonuclease/phosphatase family protein [Deltaproteobacteria bacterium]|nr:endonuclease/exonuclease/phosphatase family protein [Deltaproteobacteria bacterium]
MNARLFHLGTILILFAFASVGGCECGDDDDDDGGGGTALDDDTSGPDDDSTGADDDVDDDATDDDFVDDDSGDDDTADDDTTDDDTGDDDTADDDTFDDDTADDDTADDDEDVIVDVRVLTLNIQNPLFAGDPLDDRTQVVADFINDAQPDFVALQEVTQNLFQRNVGEVLSEKTGYDYVFRQTHYLPFLAEEGVGILSMHPIEWHDSVGLPHPEFPLLLSRAILGVRVTTEVGSFQFFGSHWTISSLPAFKADQATAALDFIYSHPSDNPAFFAGDLNAEPDMIAMRVLRGEDVWNGKTGDLVDAWLDVHPGDPGYTHPSDDPEKRIDYIYVIPGADSSFETLSCEVVLTEEVGGTRASDHAGVLCDFRLTI